MGKKKLDKKTLKWCAKQLHRYADDCAQMAGPRSACDLTAIASPHECASRAYILRRIADKIEIGDPA